MWEVLLRAPRGSNNPRKLSMLLATLFVACFGYIFLTGTPVSAATDATWDGDSITYQGNAYALTPPNDAVPNDIVDGSVSYQFTDKSKMPNLVHYIFFSPGTDNPKSAKEATYIRYTLSPPNSYSNPTGKKVITLTPAEDAPAANTEDGTVSHSCTIDGIGWIVCPLMNGISEGMDFIYERIQGFLSVQPITTSVDNPIYRIWVYSRDLANVAFIIGFMVIIYSYLVGGGFNGYEIRKILPRLVLAAILINVSYILCAAAVDISNIAGHGVNQLFESVRDNALPGSATTADLNWTSVTTWVMAGGTGAAAGALLIPGTVGGAGGLWLMLATFLFGAALVVMVTFLILAARQAIIIVLIAIAPLAFAAFILPNTEKWFEKWRSLFFTMLIMFPAFGAVFGGAQLAGEVILRTATGIEQIILGLGVMVAPLAITPLLLKLGGGVLNRIGGIVNNQQKGLYDRVKNHNEERRQQLIAENHRRNAIRRESGDFGGRRFNPRTMVRRRAAVNYARKHDREQEKKLNEEQAQEAWHRQTGRWGGGQHADHEAMGGQVTRNRLGMRQGGYGNLDSWERYNKLYHGETEANHEEHWQDRLRNDHQLQSMQTSTRLSQGRAKATEELMADRDDQFLKQSIEAGVTPRYQQARDAKVQSVVAKGLASNASTLVDAEGKSQLAETVLANANLQRQIIRTQEFEGRASQANELVEDAAKANWQQLTLNDRTIYSRQLERQGNAKQLKALQDEWESILVEASAGRTDDYVRRHGGTTPEVDTIIRNIETADLTIAAEARRKSNAEHEFKSTLTKTIKADDALLDRAAGISEQGRDKVLSQLSKEGSALHMENVAAVESYMTNEGYTLEEEKQILQGGKMRNGKLPSDMHRHAALRRIMLSNGNNWAAQQTYDYVVSQGMKYSETAGGFVDENNVLLNADEVSRRRDLQQIFKDADDKSHLKVDYLSGTDKGFLENGMLTRKDTTRTSSEQAIIRDIEQGKIGGDRAFASDIDVIMRQVQVFKDPANRARLTEDQRAKYVETLNTMLADPLLGGKLSERNWGMTKVVANLLDASDGRPVDEKIRTYVNRKGETAQIERPVTWEYGYTVALDEE